MISPTGRHVDIPIENGFVGMVDRKDFDPFLRARAEAAGAERFTGTYVRESNARDAPAMCLSRQGNRRRTQAENQADHRRGRCQVARRREEIPGGDKTPLVFAYHEIIAAPAANDEL